MRIVFTNEPQDYAEVSLVLWKRQRAQRRFWVYLGILLLLIPVLDHCWDRSAPECWWLAVLGAYFAGSVLFNPLGRYFRKLFLQHQEQPESFTADVEEESITYQSQTATQKFSWKHFSSFLETKNNFALFYGLVFYLFPKRAFAQGELEQFRELLARKIPAKQ